MHENFSRLCSRPHIDERKLGVSRSRILEEAADLLSEDSEVENTEYDRAIVDLTARVLDIDVDGVPYLHQILRAWKS